MASILFMLLLRGCKTKQEDKAVGFQRHLELSEEIETATYI